MAQQIVARIKKSSRYIGQAPKSVWFPVTVCDDFVMPLRGNSNNYRLQDVVLGVVADGIVIELASGRRIAADGPRKVA